MSIIVHRVIVPNRHAWSQTFILFLTGEWTAFFSLILPPSHLYIIWYFLYLPYSNMLPKTNQPAHFIIMYFENVGNSSPITYTCDELLAMCQIPFNHI